MTTGEGKVEKRIAHTDKIVRTADILQTQYFTRLMGLSDVVNRYASIAFKDEINWFRLRVLIILVFEKGVLTPSELARILMRPNQSVTTILDDLERNDLVVKLREPGDRRRITIRITDGGIEHVRRSLEKTALAEKELRNCLNQKELEAIGTILTNVRGHMVRLLRENAK